MNFEQFTNWYRTLSRDWQNDILKILADVHDRAENKPQAHLPWLFYEAIDSLYPSTAVTEMNGELDETSDPQESVLDQYKESITDNLAEIKTINDLTVIFQKCKQLSYPEDYLTRQYLLLFRGSKHDGYTVARTRQRSTSFLLSYDTFSSKTGAKTVDTNARPSLTGTEQDLIDREFATVKVVPNVRVNNLS